MQRAVDHESGNLLSQGHAPRLRILTRHVRTDVQITSHGCISYRPRQLKRDDIGGAGMAELLAMHRRHRARAEERDADDGICDPLSRERQFHQRSHTRCAERRALTSLRTGFDNNRHQRRPVRTTLRRCGGSVATVMCIGPDDVAHQPMPDHVRLAEVMKRDAFHTGQDAFHLHQSRLFARWQIDLGLVTGDDDF